MSIHAKNPAILRDALEQASRPEQGAAFARTLADYQKIAGRLGKRVQKSGPPMVLGAVFLAVIICAFSFIF